MQLANLLAETDQFQEIISQLGVNTRQLITGISGSFKTVLIDNLKAATNQTSIIVCDTLAHADQVFADLANVIDNDQLFQFSVEEIGAAELATSSPEYRSQRVLALNALLSNEPAVIVTSVSGIKRNLPAKEIFAAAKLTINMAFEGELAELKLKLHQMGYSLQKLVSAPGEFAIRGSILDVYPLNEELPVRIDFFDTEVDSMRTFDVANQRSIANVDQVTILPATDLITSAAQKSQLATKLRQDLAQAIAKVDEKTQVQLQNNLEVQIMDLQNGVNDAKWLLYNQFLYGQNTSLLDYLPTTGMVILDDYAKLLETDQQLMEDEANWLAGQQANGQIIEATSYTLDFKPIIKEDRHAQLVLAIFQKGINNLPLTNIVTFSLRPMQQFFSQMPVLKTEINRWQIQKQTVLILVADEKRLRKVNQTLRDFDIQATQTTPFNILERQVQVVNASLVNGFEYPRANLVIITEKEIFNQVAKKRPQLTTFSNAQRIKNYTDLKKGDYVVHVNHGIGRYDGMQTLEVDGVHQDYLTITYREGAQLFIPVTQLSMVQKYVSSEDKHPRVNKLGGSEWAKTKQKVSAKVEDIADELVDLYAQRNQQTGYAYPPDDELQTDFENQFGYSETPDQLRSIQEIKRDMQSQRPMDRLLVGDVGYGKTEVALRAAFKAIEVGKQVAFLVPTTILAQQHYETMMARFNDYPITVRVMSRFQTKAQQKQTLTELSQGLVDVVVGTHRLLSNDVKFKDLGLLIIDEEQRFGVKHKEKIKQLRTNVDVLTLTATPIPRTLNMSMMGVRDLSVIETPPTNRYPIQTYVLEQDATAITAAINREMARNGQVFYLHNRVDDIERVAGWIQTLVPEARIGYIHGQMSEAQLENRLYEFINGDYDVLVTTTIIETGVDIPNVNTLLVENADKMGLSQLYQLRGRIGRSSRVAYAYFMYEPNKVLTEIGEKRLEAIRDFTELGSGFKIAMRDLSIRGAGNLLGKQQHGFIDSVGYDLYTEMITDAVNKKQGVHKELTVKPVIELAIEAYLPEEYIDDKRQKIELYKRLGEITNTEQLAELTDDLIDRFGDYDDAVANLLQITALRINSGMALIDKIKQTNQRLELTFNEKFADYFTNKDILKAIAQTEFKASVKMEHEHYVVTMIIQPKIKNWLNQLLEMTQSLKMVRENHDEVGMDDK